MLVASIVSSAITSSSDSSLVFFVSYTITVLSSVLKPEIVNWTVAKLVMLSVFEVPVSNSKTPSPVPSSSKSGVAEAEGGVKSTVTTFSPLFKEELPASSTTSYQNV